MVLNVIPQPPKIPLDLRFQPITLGELLPQLPGQSRHLLGKRLTIVFLLFSPHIAPRGQHEVVLPDLFQAGGLAEAGDILIALAALPGMEGVGDLGDVVVGEVPQYPVPHEAQVTGIDEQVLVTTGALVHLVGREAAALVLGQQPDTGGIWVLVNSCPGRATMHSTRSSSTRRLRISPSPPVLELMEPLASSRAMLPAGARWWSMCCIQAKLALPFGGVPYRQRASSARDSFHQSFMLKGGLAITKSARRSGCWSFRKVSAFFLPKLKSMPRMAMFMAARRQVVGLDSWPYTEMCFFCSAGS